MAFMLRLASWERKHTNDVSVFVHHMFLHIMALALLRETHHCKKIVQRLSNEHCSLYWSPPINLSGLSYLCRVCVQRQYLQCYTSSPPLIFLQICAYSEFAAATRFKQADGTQQKAGGKLWNDPNTNSLEHSAGWTGWLVNRWSLRDRVWKGHPEKGSVHRKQGWVEVQPFVETHDLLKYELRNTLENSCL